MGLLKKAANNTAFAKIGILGFNGAGKTYTAANIALGICQKISADKVAFYDTEKGSDFLVKKFEQSGVELLVHKGRAFVDLISIIKECEQNNIPVLIIDSITHVWRDLCDSYIEKNKRRFMEMRDWGVVKKEWSKFTDAYIGSKVHILMLGRAGDVYEHVENENGKKEMIKNGVKMKVESETGFEPDLLIEMERVFEDGILKNKAFVVKDRSDTMNGKEFDKPDFASFKSFFDYINIGGSHVGIDTERTSKELFLRPDYSVQELERRRDIALENIKDACVLAGAAGTSQEAKKKQVELFQKVFGTSSWTAISTMKAVDLEERLIVLRGELGLTEKIPQGMDQNETIS